jgi:hypothetical protein
VGTLQNALAPVFRALGEGHRDETEIDRNTLDLWPGGLLEALLAAKVALAAPPPESVQCPGCSKACLRPYIPPDRAQGRRARVVCDQPEDLGLIELSSESLLRWLVSRQQITAFVAHEIGARVVDQDEFSGRTRFGLVKRLATLCTLEFRKSPTLLIGDDTYELVDLLTWTGRKICIDQELLRALAVTAKQTRLGGKRQQQSTANRVSKRRRTELRDQCIQDTADEIIVRDRSLRKAEVVDALRRMPLFENVSRSRLARLFIMRR